MDQEIHTIKTDIDDQYDSNAQTYANLGTLINNQQVNFVSYILKLV